MKTEKIKYISVFVDCTKSTFAPSSFLQWLTPVCHPQTLYPLSLLNGSLDEAKTSLSASSSTIGRNLTAHQSYTMVTGETLTVK